MGSPFSRSRGSAPTDTPSTNSELERAGVRGDGGAAVGIYGECFAGPPAQVLDLVGLDLRQWADPCNAFQNIVGTDGALAIFECDQQGTLDRTLDLRARERNRAIGQQLQVELGGIASALAQVN